MARYILEARGEYHPVNDKGEITRQGQSDFSESWILYALVPRWNMGPWEKYQWPELKKRIDAGERIVGYIYDIDHGTMRFWGGRYGGKLPKGKLWRVG